PSYNYDFRISSSLFVSGHPTALHSFPTRRSSDLRSTPATCSSPRHLGRPLQACPCGLLPSRFSYRHSAWRARGYVPMSDGRRPQDRKSTRLNSSHVSISYAVFCLKKKKTLKVTKN